MNDDDLEQMRINALSKVQEFWDHIGYDPNNAVPHPRELELQALDAAGEYDDRAVVLIEESLSSNFPPGVRCRAARTLEFACRAVNSSGPDHRILVANVLKSALAILCDEKDNEILRWMIFTRFCLISGQLFGESWEWPSTAEGMPFIRELHILRAKEFVSKFVDAFVT